MKNYSNIISIYTGIMIVDYFLRFCQYVMCVWGGGRHGWNNESDCKLDQPDCNWHLA